MSSIQTLALGKRHVNVCLSKNKNSASFPRLLLPPLTLLQASGSTTVPSVSEVLSQPFLQQVRLKLLSKVGPAMDAEALPPTVPAVAADEVNLPGCGLGTCSVLDNWS